MSNNTKSILENEVIFDNPKCQGFTTGSLVVKLPKDSILDSVNTGFGGENTLIKDCPKPKFKTHLCRENYLSEFSESSEKELARNNLEVYSKKEVDNLVYGRPANSSNFITVEQVEKMTEDYIKSTLKAQAEYLIPEKLFKL